MLGNTTSITLTDAPSLAAFRLSPAPRRSPRKAGPFSDLRPPTSGSAPLTMDCGDTSPLFNCTTRRGVPSPNMPLLSASLRSPRLCVTSQISTFQFADLRPPTSDLRFWPLGRLAMSAFGHFHLFLNGVPKHAKTCQKVPKGAKWLSCVCDRVAGDGGRRTPERALPPKTKAGKEKVKF